jgi:hypothetical protein
LSAIGSDLTHCLFLRALEAHLRRGRAMVGSDEHQPHDQVGPHAADVRGDVADRRHRRATSVFDLVLRLIGRLLWLLVRQRRQLGWHPHDERRPHVCHSRRSRHPARGRSRSSRLDDHQPAAASPTLSHHDARLVPRMDAHSATSSPLARPASNIYVSILPHFLTAVLRDGSACLLHRLVGRGEDHRRRQHEIRRQEMDRTSQIIRGRRRARKV